MLQGVLGAQVRVVVLWESGNRMQNDADVVLEELLAQATGGFFEAEQVRVICLQVIAATDGVFDNLFDHQART